MTKIDKRTAGFILIGLNVFTVLIDVFVILKIVPYAMIGGGRLTSYESACATSIIGILFISIQTLIVSIAGGLIKFHRFRVIIRVFTWFFFAFASFNVITNLLGKTWFEKIVFGLLCVVQAILLLRLATDKPRSETKI